MQTLQKEAERLGMDIGAPRPCAIASDRIVDYIRPIDDAVKDKELQMVIVIFESKRSDKYAAVKKKCYSQYGVPCQVVLTKTLQRKDEKGRSIVQKIGIQINAKLGGEPWGSPSPFVRISKMPFALCFRIII